MVQAYISSFLCPHCDTKCSFSGVAVGDSCVLYCRGCQQGVYFKLAGCDLKDENFTVRLETERIMDYYPRKVVIIDPAIPPEIGDDFSEANRCISVEAKKATVAMCRRVLQNACVKKGANAKTDLFDQIEELESKRIINPSMKDVAHAIRKIGNWGAHPQDDPLKDVTLDDAMEIVKFTNEFLDEVFVRPARLDALKRKKSIG